MMTISSARGSTIKVQALRARAWMSLSPETAAAAGLTLPQLQQFAGGSLHLKPEQVEALARIMKVSKP